LTYFLMEVGFDSAVARIASQVTRSSRKRTKQIQEDSQ
jgi:hypothetical protein